MLKYFKKRKLVKYLNNLENPDNNFPSGYLELHKLRIEWLKWLIASYEYGGTASDAKTLLESLLSSKLNYYDHYVSEMKKFKITPLSEVDMLKNLVKHIEFLYQWVYYKKITGF